MMITWRIYSLWCCTLLVAFAAWGQPVSRRDELTAARRKTEAHLEEIRQILAQTQSDKQNLLQELRNVNAQIGQRQALDINMRREMAFLDTLILEHEQVIRALEEDVSLLKAEYSEMVYMMSKSQNSLQKLSFLFSSRSFSQFRNRVSYLDQYRKSRQSQIIQIVRLQEYLRQKNAALQIQRDDHHQLSIAANTQQYHVSQLDQDKQKLLNALQQKEKTLRVELEAEAKTLRALSAEIEQLISTEATVATTDGTQPVEKQPDPATPLPKPTDPRPRPNPNCPFEGMRGQLPWPVAQGFIAEKFGVIEVLPHVRKENFGIIIRTTPDQKVTSIFDGRVLDVREMGSASNLMVMIQHVPCQCYTVYLNLRKVEVKPYQQVKAGDIIGSISPNREGVTDLEFQVWKGRTKTDPETWLMPK